MAGKKKIAILTGGGDCPGLNPAIRGVVMKAEQLGYECIGLQEGWKGAISGDHMPLNRAIVEEIIKQGGTILGTSRTNPYKKENGVSGVKATFKNLGLHALVAMGGEDTLGVASKLYKQEKLNVVGVPKTMDNDLSATDYTFGFDTSVTIAVDAAERLVDTGRSHRRAMVLEVMGRHAGWVSLFTGIAAAADYICIPERTVDVKDMAAKVKAAHARKKVALVVCSEAVDMGGHGEEKLDEFGHMILKERGVGERIAKLVEKETGIETRHAVIGHIQRGGAPTLFDRILGTRVGLKAAELVHEGKFGQMAALRGDSVEGVSLEEATGELKTVSPQWFAIMDTLTGSSSAAIPSKKSKAVGAK